MPHEGAEVAVSAGLEAGLLPVDGEGVDSLRQGQGGDGRNI